MNNKHKLKRIKWGTLITISCLIGIILLNTSAKSLSNSKAKVKKLTETKASCKVYENSDFNSKITISKPENERKVKVDVSIKKNIDANFWIFISEGEDMGGQIAFKTEGEFKGKDGYHGDYDIEFPIVESHVVIVYKDGIAGACGETDKTTAKNIATDYIKNKKFSDSMKTTISNQAIIAKGAYQIVEMSDDEPIEEDDSGNTEEENKIAQEIEGISSESGSIAGNSGEAILADDPKNLPDGDLFCSLNTPYKEGITKGDAYYTNNKSYYHNETTEKAYCKKTCEETITIKYGPPVATKAGMCFEYKVKVESKVSCKTKWLGDDAGLKPTKKKLCTIYPSCNGSSTYGDQAGPDTDFDSCVNKCDNGKYSQKCINKCYKEVYENVDNKKISYDNSTNDNTSGSLLATRTALSDLGIDLSTKFCQSGANDPTYYKSNYDQLMTAMRDKNNGCEYKEAKDGTIYWSCSSAHSSTNNSKYWQALGRYYFLTDNKAKQTLQSISTSCKGEPRATYYRYYIDADGFKRALFNNGTHCTQACSWKKSSKSPSDCVVSKSKRDKEYKDALEKYKTLKAACKAEASCSTTVAKFTISATNEVAKNYKDGKVSETGDITSTFNANAHGKSITHSTNGNPIIDSGGCYGSSSGDYNYMTEWAFPGSWRNNKNGTISQTKPIDDNGWSERKNYYCTSLDSVGVNSNWWNWAQYKKLKDKTNYEDSSIKYNGTSDSIEYNITATTNNFGHFGWNVTMQCFYATPSDKTTTPPPECEGEDGCGTETPKFEYEARSVDTKEMFPEDSRGSGDEQIIGFNWTDKANENLEVDTNEKVTIDGKKQQPISYEIKPDALKEDIKKQAEDGKTYSDENLEYYVQLNRKALNELKKMKIGEFKGTFESCAVGKEGVKVYTIQRYKTNLIDNYGGTRKRTTLCNNWDNGNCRKYS